MASSQSWTEYNGASSATVVTNRTDVNWKNIDDSTTTAYSASPVTAGLNSFFKVQALLFGGTYNSLSAFTYKVSTNAPATGVSLVASVVTTTQTSSATSTGDGAASTSGTSANFVSGSTPFGTGTSSYVTAGGVYANPYRTQIQTTGSAGPGDISAITITASWTES